MDSKMIENFLREIIEIDLATITEVETIETEIANRQSQLKKIATKIEENSEVLKLTQSKRLLERIQSETDAEIEKINKECDELLSSMERLFDEKKSKMIERAFEKLSINRWDESCIK